MTPVCCIRIQNQVLYGSKNLQKMQVVPGETTIFSERTPSSSNFPFMGYFDLPCSMAQMNTKLNPRFSF
jgi:hypothetical protein